MSNLLYDRLFGCHQGEEKPFLIFADGAQQSYDSFLRQTARFANVIQAIGLEVGDRLAAQVEKSAEALALYAACVQSGVIFLPLNTAYTPAEVSYFVGDSGAKLVVADQNFDLEEYDALLS
ncbi:MAG: malonyl-CoA synthase, partial [Alphaproteobacteria bacterium]|nr:malonyl-CoA synthase [Alphaproteobacteria bacterium]